MQCVSMAIFFWDDNQEISHCWWTDVSEQPLHRFGVSGDLCKFRIVDGHLIVSYRNLGSRNKFAFSGLRVQTVEIVWGCKIWTSNLVTCQKVEIVDEGYWWNVACQVSCNVVLPGQLCCLTLNVWIDLMDPLDCIKCPWRKELSDAIGTCNRWTDWPVFVYKQVAQVHCITILKEPCWHIKQVLYVALLQITSSSTELFVLLSTPAMMRSLLVSRDLAGKQQKLIFNLLRINLTFREAAAPGLVFWHRSTTHQKLSRSSIHCTQGESQTPAVIHLRVWRYDMSWDIGSVLWGLSLQFLVHLEKQMCKSKPVIILNKPHTWRGTLKGSATVSFCCIPEIQFCTTAIHCVLRLPSLVMFCNFLCRMLAGRMKYFVLMGLCFLIVTQIQTLQDPVVTLGALSQSMVKYVGSVGGEFFGLAGLCWSNKFQSGIWQICGVRFTHSAVCQRNGAVSPLPCWGKWKWAKSAIWVNLVSRRTKTERTHCRKFCRVQTMLHYTSGKRVTGPSARWQHQETLSADRTVGRWSHSSLHLAPFAPVRLLVHRERRTGFVFMILIFEVLKLESSLCVEKV